MSVCEALWGEHNDGPLAVSDMRLLTCPQAPRSVLGSPGVSPGVHRRFGKPRACGDTVLLAGLFRSRRYIPTMRTASPQSRGSRGMSN